MSLRTLLREVLEDQLSLEARSPRTLHALLLRPGLLTADYREGRIARYVPPTRLYLVTGLVFFLVFVASFEGGCSATSRRTSMTKRGRSWSERRWWLSGCP